MAERSERVFFLLGFCSSLSGRSTHEFCLFCFFLLFDSGILLYSGSRNVMFFFLWDIAGCYFSLGFKWSACF